MKDRLGALVPLALVERRPEPAAGCHVRGALVPARWS
jgi:hypothetical protein